MHAAPKFYSPVKPAELPHRHPEWTDFEIEPRDTGARKRQSAGTIRARKNTKLQIENGVLHLQFTGDDPGIAIDQMGRELANGPYRLSFRLSSKTEGKGEVFYTTKPELTLPKGDRVEFDVESADQWQDIQIEISTNQRIHKLRLEVGEGPGKAAIADLTLSDQHGNVLIAWPTRYRQRAGPP